MRSQFGSFDGLDNRKDLMRLFARFDEGFSSEAANERRGRFLQSLMKGSQTLPDKLLVTPCDAVRAYHLFVAICGCLGVDINQAARKLEAFIRDDRRAPKRSPGQLAG